MLAAAAEQQLPIPEILVREVQGSGVHVAGIFLQPGELPACCMHVPMEGVGSLSIFENGVQPSTKGWTV